jgi:hypothetical protein
MTFISVSSYETLKVKASVSTVLFYFCDLPKSLLKLSDISLVVLNVYKYNVV